LIGFFFSKLASPFETFKTDQFFEKQKLKLVDYEDFRNLELVNSFLKISKTQNKVDYENFRF
jgi:hypothetical protein